MPVEFAFLRLLPRENNYFHTVGTIKKSLTFSRNYFPVSFRFKTPHCFLTDQGAAKFAAANGIPTIPGQQLVTERNKKRLEKEKLEKDAQKADCQK